MGKLYGEFTGDDWLRIIGLTSNQVPETLILHGEDDRVEKNLKLWEKRLSPILARPRWNMLIGRYRGKTVGFAHVMWAPMAAIIAHKFCQMGTAQVIQTGAFGGLHPKIRYGQILVVTSATGEDGVSTAYDPKHPIQKSNARLVHLAIKGCHEKKFTHTTGSIVTTSAILLETSSVVRQWGKKGYVGVDGETAATFAVARRFGVPAVALLNCSDLLIQGDNLYEYDAASERFSLEVETDKKIVELALWIALRYTKSIG